MSSQITLIDSLITNVEDNVIDVNNAASVEISLTNTVLFEIDDRAVELSTIDNLTLSITRIEFSKVIVFFS